MNRLIIAILCALFTCNLYSQSKNQAPWQQRVNYIIDVSLDDTAHSISGEILMEYTNNSPDELSFIYIHLWPNAYKNDKTAFAKQMLGNGELDFYHSDEDERGYIDQLDFNANGKKLTWTYEAEDIAKVILDKPLVPGKTVSLYTPFHVKIPKVFSRLGHENQDYFMTQWYPKPAVYDVNGWNQMPYLNQGEFYSEFGSFKVSVKLPENYIIAATGTCTTPGELGEGSKPGYGDSTPPSSTTFKTVEFTADDIHDFAWFASKSFGYETKQVQLEGKTVLARVVAATPRVKDLAHIETALTYYSEHVGVYPYEHATVVHGELKAGGGMEYPMITLCDFMGKEVIVHEVGHNWFYGILGNNERIYPWMDESINSYYEGEAMKNGKDVGDGINATVFNVLAKDEWLRNEWQAIGDESKNFTSGNYGTVVYGVGAKSMGYLKDYLGDEMFKQAMLNYYEEWKYKHPLPDDMKVSYEATTGKDLSWFFDDLINSDDIMDYGISKKGGDLILTNHGTIGAPVKVTFIGETSKTQWEQLAPGESKVITPALASYTNVVLDKDVRSQDAFSNNDKLNTKITPKLFIGKDKKGERELYILPSFGWNGHDKWMAGLTLHNYSFSNKKWQYSLTPMYSFEQKDLVGRGSIYTTQRGKGTGAYRELGLELQRFHFTNRSSLADDVLRYDRVSPHAEFNLAKTSQRSKKSKKLKLQIDHIMFTSKYDIETDTLSGPELQIDKTRSFVTADYQIKNKRAVNPYQFNIMAEFGNLGQRIVLGDLNDKQIRYVTQDTLGNPLDTIYYFPNIGEDTRTDNFMRLSSILDYNVDIGIKDKPLEVRLYGSYILKSLSEISSPFDKNRVGSIDGAEYFDYKMNDLLMYRNAESGMFRNQISNRTHFSKFVGPVAESDKWLLSANVTAPFPGKIPIKLYGEILTFNDIKTSTVNSSGVGFLYNGGLELEIIPNRFEIFFNLFQSEDVSLYQENNFISIDKFMERITFVFDINDLTPDKIKKSINLF